MLLSEHIYITNMFKQKDWAKRWVPATSTRCPDHLSRQFLTTATTFPYSSKNSSAEHIHAFYTCPCVCVCVCVCVCLPKWVSVFVRVRHVDKAWICWDEEFLELYGKVEAAVRNCLLRLSGHLVEVAGTPSLFRSVFFSFKHTGLFVHRQEHFSAGLGMLNIFAHIASRISVCISEGCVFLLLCNYVSLLSLQIEFLWFMNLMNNGQMERGNENPIQHLPWRQREAMKKSQSGWLGPGFEIGTSQIRVQCVNTAPPSEVAQFLFRRID